MKIKKILVPLDGSSFSEKGLKVAIEQAKLMGAEICGVNVVSIHPTLAATVLDYKKFATKQSEKILNTAKLKCESENIRFTSKILYGKPSSKIAEFASKEKSDLIIIGSRGLSGIKHSILGSIASAIVQKSKISVMVIK